MTQHRFSTLDGADVLCGWDRPLQYFFLDITKECTVCNGEGGFGDSEDIHVCGICSGEGEIRIYGNLEDDELPRAALTLQQVKDRLERYLTAYPPELLVNLLNERKDNVGNRITGYDPIGEVRDNSRVPI